MMRMQMMITWLALVLAVGGCATDEPSQPGAPTGSQLSTMSTAIQTDPGNGTAAGPAAPTTNPTPVAGPTPGANMSGGAPIAGNGAAAPVAGPVGPTAPTAPVDTPTAPVNPVDTPPAGQGGDGTPAPGNAAGSDCGEPGLDLEGMVYSPGGTLLPHPCEPFHPTHNNPYAVLCVDVWPWYETRFPGDDLCILPPEPGKGIQYGVHPQGLKWHEQVSQGDMSGYDNIDPSHILRAGGEEEKNYITSTDNTENKNFYRYYMRMRSGSHHSIVSGTNAVGPASETWGPGAPTTLFTGTGLPGGQRVDTNLPVSLEKPAEDKGLYRRLPANQHVTLNMHHFNSTDGDILKEVWTNLWYEEQDATTEMVPMFGMPLTQAAATFAQPGQTVDIHYSWTFPADTRVLELYGHSHAWTSNFSAWVQKPSGETNILYQSFDWFDKPTYRYDSLTTNPAPNPDQLLDGGASGITMINAGDQLHFNCHMSFTPERAAAVDGPQPNTIGPLRFANQAFRGEMCILFGLMAGRNIGSPATALTPLPGFATVD